MANITGGTAGNLWNLPGLDGILFSRSAVNTPFLDRINRVAIVDAPEFAMSAGYDHETAAQPAITETASLTAPNPVSYVRQQERNVCQIFHEKVSVSYAKLSAAGRLQYVENSTSGYAYSLGTGQNAVKDELQFQIKGQLEKIRRDFEYTALQGTFALSTGVGVAFGTRGIITGSTTNTVAAGGAGLSSTLINSLLKTMADNSAPFNESKFVIFCNAFQRQKISSIYGYAPSDRNVGGVSVDMIYTDFGQMEVVYSPFMPAATVLIAAIDRCAVVFQPVPNKATIVDGKVQNVLLEKLAVTGAAENWQLFVQMGIDYGSSYFHGTITGLATA